MAQSRAQPRIGPVWTLAQEGWKLLLSPDSGELLGKELDSQLLKPERRVDKLQLLAR